jgi:hypothetical protein
MVPVAAATAAGWLILFIVLLAVPPPRPRQGGGRAGGPVPEPPGSGAEPPAVISLLAGRLGKDGFGATLLDLAARDWFRLRPGDAPVVPARRGPAGRASGPGSAGPVICVVPAEAPGEQLTPYERRAVAHVAVRAGARGVVPAPALSDGFEGGEADFMKAFGDEVAADARRRGLTRPRLSPGRIALLCALLLIPAGALVLAIHAIGRPDALTYAGVGYAAMCWLAVGVGSSRRATRAGREALDRWRSALAGAPGGGAGLAASGGGGRPLAYAAALGRAPGAVAAFGAPGKNAAWSSYRGGWQQITVETSTWSWPRTVVVLLALTVGPLVYLGGVIWLVAHGMVALAEEGIGLLVAAVTGLITWTVLGRRLFPRFAEFDGQVIRQWVVKGDNESPDQYHIAVDDGTRAKAWDLPVGSGCYAGLAPGALVHARVSLWKPRQATVHLVEPAAVARQLADPGVPHDPRGPAGRTP